MMVTDEQLTCQRTWKSDQPVGDPEDTSVYRQHRCGLAVEHTPVVCVCRYCKAPR